MQLADRHKEGNVHFLGASEKTEIMDVAQLVIKDIQNVNEQNIESYDAFKKQKCVINTQLDVVVADFSMTSYCCNHLGASANKFCPRCHAEADNFNEIVRLRTPAETQRTIQRIDMRSNESDKKRLRTLTGVKENDNCFWDVLDPHRDIPVGLLHLIPLGLAKHIIKFVLNNVGSDTVEKLSYHLIDTLGNGYKDFFKHFNSRQGKDLKSYLQIAPFNLLYAKVPSKFIDMVTCLANIHKKLNKDSFTSSDYDDLRYNIRQYHEQIKRDAPELKKKVKSHLLLHVVS
ncbi:unnamed protein product [Mytilus coruscus]|uniref:Uncharacterized protein n=1 Tax=Mytilus coruscus TaxID=42192 RepID=A0A6J8C0X2_MYTCO|nr:unnamed protein product [Mytilus coruscus]